MSYYIKPKTKIYWERVGWNATIEEGDFWANYDLTKPYKERDQAQLQNNLCPHLEPASHRWIGNTPNMLSDSLQCKGWKCYRPIGLEFCNDRVDTIRRSNPKIEEEIIRRLDPDL